MASRMDMSGGVQTGRAAQPRLHAIDLARTVLILGMVVFHFVFDLEAFGLVAPGTTRTGAWASLARLVAGGFLFVAGISLWLAHANGFRGRAFLRRLAVIAGAAALVSLGTWAAVPQSFVYFGILHAIAASSVAGLLFLRLPWPFVALAGIVALVLPRAFAGVEVFDQPWFLWLGLAETPRPAVDYVPFFPWVAPFLFGLALAKVLRLERGPPALARPLPAAITWPGRHSLIIYLLHQPLLIGALWALAQLGLIGAWQG